MSAEIFKQVVESLEINLKIVFHFFTFLALGYKTDELAK
jgi:hypothetical protein